MPRYGRRRQPRLRHRQAKAVLNTTSRKKRDNMLSVSNTTPLGAPQSEPNSGTGRVHIRGGDPGPTTQNGAIFVWSPTMRPINDNTMSDNVRASRDVYHKGFREIFKVETNSAAAFMWRRIVVESKEPAPYEYEGGGMDQPPHAFVPWYTGPSGVARLWYNQYGNKAAGVDNKMDDILEQWYSYLFEGTRNNDWAETMIAKVDLDRWKLRFDRTFKLISNNQEGLVRKMKFYHPFESTMYYDHDESGSGTGNQSVVCSQSKKGMGNVYIIDIIEGAFSSDDTDVLRLTPESCAYWHEK